MTHITFNLLTAGKKQDLPEQSSAQRWHCWLKLGTKEQRRGMCSPSRMLQKISQLFAAATGSILTLYYLFMGSHFQDEN